MVEGPQPVPLVVQKLGDEIRRLSVENAYLKANRENDQAAIRELSQKLQALQATAAQPDDGASNGAPRRPALLNPTASKPAVRETIAAEKPGPTQ